jgi:hypothetical protein
VKADISRDTFDPSERYSGVLMQQGRVQLDSEWNEQQEIHQHRVQSGTGDVIGPCGTPIDGTGEATGFEITAKAGKLCVGTGSLYVDGVLCVNEREVSHDEEPAAGGQPYPPDPADLTKWMENDDLKLGLVYLDVWERHVTHFDDERIREVALGGPDTTTRKQTVWQIKVMKLDAKDDDVDFLTEYAGLRAKYDELREKLEQEAERTTRRRSKKVQSELEELEEKLNETRESLKNLSVRAATLLGGLCRKGEQKLDELREPPTGALSARTKQQESTTNRCQVPPGGGYERLENQLYRVEIHSSGNRGGARFKWSRDNGSVVTGIESIDHDKKEITVKDAGRDEYLSFANGQWVEVVDDRTELQGQPRKLLQVKDLIGRTVVVEQTPPHWNEVKGRHPKLRRWDQRGTAAELQDGVKLDDQELEDGIEVEFSGDEYRAGDYWLMPARTATGDIEWPLEKDGKTPQPRSPHGVQHGFCGLAVVAAVPQDDVSEEGSVGSKSRLAVLHDCRSLFPQLTKLTSFFYLGGDGQEAMPGNALLEPLRVGVANGQWPVEGARVRFKTDNGALQGGDGSPEWSEDENPDKTIIVLTNEHGVAACWWKLDATNQNQHVTATLLDVEEEDGVDEDDAGHGPLHLPIYFSANLSVAKQVAYDVPSDCGTLSRSDAKADTVQKALERLSILSSLYYVSGNGQEVMPANKDKLRSLEVLVANRCGPVKDAMVKFEVVEGGGQFSQPSEVSTNANGIASCKWTLGPTATTQRAKATLVSAPSSVEHPNPIHEPLTVHFTANLSVATEVAYKTCPDSDGPTVRSELQIQASTDSRVADVLDALLCSFNATHLPLDKTGKLCETLSAPAVITVQDALDALCRMDVGAGGCEVTVGEGGMYGKLEEALEALEGRSDVCIRMLSGEHEIPESLTIRDRANVRIKGCTPGTRIILGGPLRFESLSSLDLKDIQIVARNVERLVEIGGCAEVRLDSCYLISMSESERALSGTLLAVGRGADRIHLEHNRIEALPSRPTAPFDVFGQVDSETTRLFIDEEEGLFARHYDRGDFGSRALRVARALVEFDSRDRFAEQFRESAVRAREVDVLGAKEFEIYEAFAQTLVAAMDDPDRSDRLHKHLKDIRDAAAKMSNGTAIVVADADADLSLEDNDVAGDIYLYGAPHEGTSLSRELKGMAEKLSSGALSLSRAAGTLHLRNNDLTSLAVGARMAERINALNRSRASEDSLEGLYAESFITDNTIARPYNHFVAFHVALTSTFFTANDTEPVGAFSGIVIGDSAIYMGNHTSMYEEVINVSRRHEAAGNLDFSIVQL